MPEIQIPPIVAELLEPISSATPANRNAEDSEEYIKLEMEIGKSTPDYKAWINWSASILQERGKHLRVAVWLGFAWYRTEGIAGLRNGLILILELMKRYGDKLLPERAAHRSKAFAFINGRLPKFMAEDKITTENATYILDIQTLLMDLVTECEKQFPNNVPTLKGISEVIDAHVEKAKSMVGVAPDSQEAASKSPTVEPVPADTGAMDTAPVVETETAAESIPEKKKTEDEAAFPLPGEVAELVNPISPDAPAGEDPIESEKYIKLELDTNAPTPNYKEWIELATDILCENGKHLRVAVWLCYAWYRTQKLPGLRNGLLLIYELLSKYNKNLFPEKETHRSKTLLFLNTKLPPFLKRDKINAQNAKDAETINKIFNKIQKECHKQFPDHPLNLKNLEDIIQTKMDEAKEHLVVKEEKSDKITKKDEQSSEGDTGNGKVVIKEKIVYKESGAKIASDKEATARLRNTLSFFFQEEKDGKKKNKVPDNSGIYRMSRALQWSEIALPPDKDKVTQIEGPPPARQTYILKLFTGNDWDALIPAIEIDFIKPTGFKYWLDAQRFVVQALTQKGGKFGKAAEAIKIQLAQLIERVPGLPKLKFKDKKTLFADKDTLVWLDEEVKGAFGSGGGDDLLPPIMGEDYDPINKAFEAACSELPNNFDKQAQAMQQAIEGDTRRKGRFLRISNLAKYCYQARQYGLAKILLTQLTGKIEAYQLTEWEPALCVDVWKDLYMTYIKIMSLEEDAHKNFIIEQELEGLFQKIGNYDCVLALKLSNRQPKEGE